MRVAVTGGAGFIGSAVVHHLKESGHEPVVLDHVNEQHAGADIRDAKAMREALVDCDACIHLAGVLGTHELFDTPSLAVQSNVQGTLNVLEACVANGARYVGIGMPDVFPSLYTATKQCAIRLATAYHRTHGLLVSHVRAFNVFGPGQKHGPGHPQKIIPTFATEAWAGRPIPIWGDGTQTVDLVHVDDLARLLVAALDHGGDVTFDGGTGVALSVNEVADFVLAVTGSKAGVEHREMRRGEVPSRIVASGTGWELLDGWKPTFDWQRLGEAVRSYPPFTVVKPAAWVPAPPEMLRVDV